MPLSICFVNCMNNVLQITIINSLRAMSTLLLVNVVSNLQDEILSYLYFFFILESWNTEEYYEILKMQRPILKSKNEKSQCETTYNNK